MKTTTRHFIILCTAPKRTVARKIATAILNAKLAACVNLVPAIESHYWWKGKISRDPEILLLIKTTKAKLPALEKLILTLHPYETPEIIVLNVSAGSKKYLDWIDASVL